MNLVLLLLSLVSGIFIIYLLAPEIPRAARWTLAATLSLVLHALLYFWLLMVQADFNKATMVTAATGFILFSVMVIRRKTGAFSSTRWGTAGLFFVLLLLATCFNYLQFSVPWGDWDGWAIWNPHAMFLYHSDHWTRLFSEQYGWSHPDYPLMLPSMIAMFWKPAGSVHYIVPVIIGALPLAGIMVLLFSEAGDPRAGIFAALVVAVDSNFSARAASQYADGLLAFFCLLTVVVIKRLESTKAGKTSLLFFLGFVSASCLWVKNEGIFFFVLTAIYSLVVFRKVPGFFRGYVSGVIPMLLTWAVFKLFLAPPNDFAGILTFKTVHKMLDPGRYVIILIYTARVILTEYPLLPFMLLFFIARRRTLPGYLVIPAITFLIYLSVYLVTPHNLAWHLETSLNRLILHVYPAVLFIFAGMVPAYRNELHPLLPDPRYAGQP